MGVGASITLEGGRREGHKPRKPLIGIASAWLGIASVMGTVFEGLALPLKVWLCLAVESHVCMACMEISRERRGPGAPIA